MSDMSMLINGLKVTAEKGATFERRNPLDGSVATRAPAASSADAVMAVEAAAEAFKTWSESGPSLRRTLLPQSLLRLEEFADQWGQDYPTIVKSWRSNWQRIVPFFEYPPEIRRIIYTTNAIESVNMSLRKVTKSRGSFPSDEALLKLFYLALNNISKKWTMPLRDWKAALTRFTIQFEGRMPKD